MKRAILTRLVVVLLVAILLVFTTILYVYRSYAIRDAKERALSIAELVRDTLTSYMVMGVIDKRDEFLSRIGEIRGVEDIRVIRGEPVIRQFGEGLKYELAKDEIERRVLKEGKTIDVLEEGLSQVYYRIVIPYRAEPIKGVNCLQCHVARPGETLGAISLVVNLSHVRSEIAKASFLAMSLFVFALFMVILYVYNFLGRLQKFFKELILVMNSAKEGIFENHLQSNPGFEAQELKTVVEQSFSSLSKTFENIEEKVRAMMGYGVLKTGNALSDTSKIVDELLKIYRFKRVIEKDKNKRDIYARLINMLEDYMSIDSFSLYEVNHTKNQIEIIHVKGKENWCKEIICQSADECRAKRTGMDVDSREFPCICPNFIDNEACLSGRLHYYCIPLYVGGAVGNVLQIVYEPEIEPFINLIIPYIKAYLNESAPVLEARTYMDILREQSLKDQLTGLYNRRFLEDVIDKLTAQVRRRGTILGVLMVDIDYFKQVNDAYGHDVGDRVLVETAKVILRTIRESDIVVRYGGEEFLVLLVDAQPGKSEEVGEKIRSAVEKHTIELPGVVLKKTVSIGVSEYPIDSDKIWQCIKYADVALYKAKEAGRNRVVRFKAEFWQREEY
ncbi:MAG: GGDEF domain-containing protein [Acidobacteria bacterium]|nr:MAG: GGDEF domain-containing protein [Acidobacteriota bacterium]